MSIGLFALSELPLYVSEQAYDVADLLKQYFRELPEPLLTNKLSETFIGIHLCKSSPQFPLNISTCRRTKLSADVPGSLRLEAVQKAVLLLPDENREVLHSLLTFLNDISLYAESNQVGTKLVSFLGLVAENWFIVLEQ